jgi:hypothetical protein
MARNHFCVLFTILSIAKLTHGLTDDASEETSTLFTPKTESDFLNYKIQNKFVIALLVNQSAVSIDLQQKLVGQLAQALRHQYPLAIAMLGMAADTSAIPSLAVLYKVDEVINAKIILFVSNQVVEFPDIIETIEESDDENLLANSITLRLDQVIRELEMPRQLFSAVDGKTVAVYFGERDRNFEYFEQLAFANIDFSYLYCFDRHLRLKIYRELSIAFDEHRAFDEVVIVRSQSDTTPLDPRTSAYSQQAFTTTSLNAFFELERYPKLRKNIMALENIRKLYQKRQVMLLFVKDPSQPESHLLENEFTEAVGVLPRRMIFVVTEIDDPDSGPYHGFASQTGGYLMHNGIYVMHAYALQPTMAQLPATSMTKEDIVDYVFRFYETNRYLWEFYEEKSAEQARTPQLVNEEL